MAAIPSAPRVARFTTAGAVVAGVLVVAAFASFVARGDGVAEMFDGWLLHNGPVGLVGTAVMAAALRRQPRNRAAWMFYVSAMAAAVHTSLIAVSYAVGDRYPEAWAALNTGTIALRDVPRTLMWPLWASSWLWLVSAGTVITFALLYFPDGHLPSRRWRPVVWAAAVGICLATVGYAWGNRPWSAYLVDRNGPGLGDPVAGLIVAVGMPLLGGAALATIVSLVVRLQTSTPLVRAQVRPVVITGSLVAGSMVLLWPWRTVWALVNVPVIVLFVVTVGATVARHRLFDVEVAVSRAVVVTALGGFVTVGYVAVVVGLGLLVGSPGSLWTSVLATALIAVSFDPVRRRVQRWARRTVTGARVAPDEVLAAVGEQLGRAAPTEEVLGRIASVLVDGTGAVAAEIRGGDVALDVMAGTPPPSAPAVQTVPVTHEGEVLGELRLLADREDRFTPGDEWLLSRVAGTLGPVLRAAALTRDLEQRIEDLRTSRRRIVTAQEEARRALERDIHDGAQQQLLALRLSLGLAETFAEQADTSRVLGVLGEASRRTDGAIRSLRALARGLFPPILAEQGLVAAVRAHARDVPLHVRVDGDGVGRLDRDLETAVYFCCLEAMQNATKHAEATGVTVTFRRADDELVFSVADDGAGFDRDDDRGEGAGLTNMRDRVEGLGGVLVVASSPGEGTTIVGRVPVPAEAPTVGGEPTVVDARDQPPVSER